MKKLLFLLLIPVIAGSCYNDKEALLYPSPTCDATNVRFSNQVKAIMDNSCAIAGCHTSNAASGGYNLSSVTDVQRSAGNGTLVGTITHASGYSPMPRNAPPLSDCDISQIRAWVAAGAPNN